MSIGIVLGTRPEIIKMAPVIRECQKRGLDYSVIRAAGAPGIPAVGGGRQLALIDSSGVQEDTCIWGALCDAEEEQGEA